MRYPQLYDPAWLRSQYVDDGASVTAIADELGCARNLVHRALRRAGIPTGRQGVETGVPALREAAWLRDRIVTQGQSGAELARELGCDPSLVHRWVRHHGIRRSNHGR